MPKAEQSTEVTKAGAGGLQVSSVIFDQLHGLKTDGFENVSASDLGLPFIKLLQDISDETKPRHENYIKGAEAGMYFNTLTKELYETLTVIPIGFDKAYVEWKDRLQGGGFVGRFDPTDPRVSASQRVGKKLVSPDGNDMQETAEHYVMVIPSTGSPFVALFPMKVTQLKHSKAWLSEMTSKTIEGPNGPQRLPMYLQKYELGAKIESNAANEWFVTTFTFLGIVDDELAPAAIAAANSFEQTNKQAAKTYTAQADASSTTIDAVAESMK